MVAMVVVGSLVNRIDSRVLLAVGLAIFSVSSLALSHINLGIAMSAVAWPNFWNGFGGGFVFVPLTTLGHGPAAQAGNGQRGRHLQPGAQHRRQHRHRRADGRNLVRGSQTHQNYLGAHLTAGSPRSDGDASRACTARFVVAGADAVTAHREALGALYGSLQQQSAVLAYADNFRLLGYLSLACIPLALLLARPGGKAPSAAAAGE